MKALQFMAPNAMSVNEIATPKIADDEVLLASRSVGICHSDIELLEGRYIIPFDYPIIPGHEWAAEVMEVGSKVSKFKAGDRVVGECVIGQEHFGFSISGAMAEFFIAKADWLHKLPENVSWTQGALVEPFSCGYYATVRTDNMDASDTIAVFGAGPIGLGVIAASAAKGGRVIAIEPSQARAEIARSLGAEIIVDPTTQSVKEAILEATKGSGASVVIDASGRPDAMASTLEVAGFRGRIVIIGISVGGKASAELGLIQFASYHEPIWIFQSWSPLHLILAKQIRHTKRFLQTSLKSKFTLRMQADDVEHNESSCTSRDTRSAP